MNETSTLTPEEKLAVLERFEKAWKDFLATPSASALGTFYQGYQAGYKAAMEDAKK